jgi:penicillin amidase
MNNAERNQYDAIEHEPRLATRREPGERTLHPHDPSAIAAALPPADVNSGRKPAAPRRRWAVRLLRAGVVLLLLLAAAGGGGFFYARHWLRGTTAAALPQIDGTLPVAGLHGAVSVQRDVHGVPHIHAGSLDDLVFAQAFVTAEDRLFQMDTLRRHAAGELAEILGAALIPHDKQQRTLQIRAAADRAVAALPADQIHLLEVYAQGVNAAMAQQAAHLPIEFRLLGYQPAPWTPRDSVLVSLAMFQDLTDEHATKLDREALTAQLTAAGAADLIPDLYPVGSWRDHPPANAAPDLTIPGPPIEEVPLDESQARVARPNTGRPEMEQLALGQAGMGDCPACFPGSNNWVVSGAHTASGKPLLSNDMHLTATLPGIWYEADLEAPMAGSAEPLHVAGVSIPGLPLIVVGHNAHVAWGFTNLGADVQDIYIESVRGSGDAAEFQAVDGSWQPVVHLPELIKVKHGKDVELDVTATRHGDAVTPILTPLLPGETRQLALRWVLYEPGVVQIPSLDIDSAHDWPSFLAAFAKFGGPAQNVVYADDQGHIGYHAAGRIPLRGPAVGPPGEPAVRGELPTDVEAPPASPAASAAQTPPAPNPAQLSGPLSPVPLKPSTAHEWSGMIPFEQLPQVFNPPSGIIATANGRTAPDNYPYPITLNWGAAYRTERILHLLLNRTGLRPADMLAIQTDVYSDFDHVLAQRLAYALDHSSALAGKGYKQSQAKTLRQAADFLRTWNGRMTTDSPAAAIVFATHNVLWPMLLDPHLRRASGEKPAGEKLAGEKPAGDNLEPALLYQWYSHDYAMEQLLMHTPERWLPPGFSNWDDLLAAAVLRGLTEAKAPSDLAKWRYGSIHTVDVEHPIFAQQPALGRLLGRPTGTGNLPQSGDGTTVKQVGHTFGPSERFTADFGNLDGSTLNIVLGQSANPDSAWFLDQFPAWYHGTTFALPFTDQSVNQAATHTLTLSPK